MSSGSFFGKKFLRSLLLGRQFTSKKKLMLFEDLDAGGTADFIALWYNDKGKLTAALGDCKFGRVKINPDDEQLKFYLAALNKLVRNKGKEIEEFISFVYQPESYGKFHKHTFTKSEILRQSRNMKKRFSNPEKKPKFKVGIGASTAKLAELVLHILSTLINRWSLWFYERKRQWSLLRLRLYRTK